MYQPISLIIWSVVNQLIILWNAIIHYWSSRNCSKMLITLFAFPIPSIILTVGTRVWHMPHGINICYAPKNSYNYFWLYKWLSLAKMYTLSCSINFYCCKRLLGRNNTAVSSTPHQGRQHLCRVLYYSPTMQRAPASSGTSSDRRWCSSIGNLYWLTRPVLGSFSSQNIKTHYMDAQYFHATSCASPSSDPILKTLPPLVVHLIKVMPKNLLNKWKIWACL